MDKKEISTGNINFKEIIEQNRFYVDKTKMIEDLIKSGKKSILFPRPRRFGKTLTMSMLDNFFDIEKKETNQDLFKGLYIENSKYYDLRGTIPVISISFKDIEESNFNLFLKNFKTVMVNLYEAKRKEVYDNLNEVQKKYFDLIVSGDGDEVDTKYALSRMMTYLKQVYNQNVLLLIDEYDVPIQKAYSITKDFDDEDCYYNKVIDFVKTVFSSCAKDNLDLYMAIFTGVLRVSHESIFSGLNNFVVYGLMNSSFPEYFGFTEKETKELLEYYDLELTDEVKNMYDGYVFNDVNVYNPWSILNYANDKILNLYWLNTSSNKLIKSVLKDTTEYNKIVMESLVQGEDVLFNYDENITYKDLTNPNDLNAILNVLFASGYLTFSKKEETVDGIKTYLKIPNQEVSILIAKIMQEAIFADVPGDYPRRVIEAVTNYDKEKLEGLINDILSSSSYMDNKEAFYHGFVLALFSTCLNNKNYYIDSNREAGMGRYDIILERTDKTYGYVFEFKIAKKEEDMEEAAKLALTQIEEKEYYQKLIKDEMKEIRKCSIVFQGKKCIVR